MAVVVAWGELWLVFFVSLVSLSLVLFVSFILADDSTKWGEGGSPPAAVAAPATQNFTTVSRTGQKRKVNHAQKLPSRSLARTLLSKLPSNG